MTTIAASVKYGVMAADSKCNFGDSSFPVIKIFRLKDGSLLGTAGSAIYTAPFEDSMKQGKRFESKEPLTSDIDFAALHLTKDGLYVFDNSFHADRVEHGLFAIGSGGMIAYSYLLNGAHPVYAIERACEVDVNSGLPTHIEKLRGRR